MRAPEWAATTGRKRTERCGVSSSTECRSVCRCRQSQDHRSGRRKGQRHSHCTDARGRSGSRPPRERSHNSLYALMPLRLSRPAISSCAGTSRAAGSGDHGSLLHPEGVSVATLTVPARVNKRATPAAAQPRLTQRCFSRTRGANCMIWSVNASSSNCSLAPLRSLDPTRLSSKRASVPNHRVAPGEYCGLPPSSRTPSGMSTLTWSRLPGSFREGLVHRRVGRRRSGVPPLFVRRHGRSNPCSCRRGAALARGRPSLST